MRYCEFDDEDLQEQVADELRRVEHLRKRYQQELTAHPDCNAPDHPGCESCCGEEEAE